MPPAQPPTQPPIPFSTTSILIADDDPAALLLLRRTLESEGYNVVEAHDGVEALEMFEQSHPILVLLDALMPNMSGLAACARIRELPEGRDVPVIIVTAADDPETISLVQELNAAYVGKPFSVIELRQRVNGIILSR